MWLAVRGVERGMESGEWVGWWLLQEKKMCAMHSRKSWSTVCRWNGSDSTAGLSSTTLCASSGRRQTAGQCAKCPRNWSRASPFCSPTTRNCPYTAVGAWSKSSRSLHSSSCCCEASACTLCDLCRSRRRRARLYPCQTAASCPMLRTPRVKSSLRPGGASRQLAFWNPATTCLSSQQGGLSCVSATWTVCRSLNSFQLFTLKCWLNQLYCDCETWVLPCCFLVLSDWT